MLNLQTGGVTEDCELLAWSK